MAVIQSGSTTDLASVNTDKALQVEVRAPAFGGLGAYLLAQSSGNIAATLAANSTLFSMRWTDASKLCLIRSIRIGAMVQSAITTAVNFDAECIMARSFSGVDSGGTAMTLTGNNNKARTSFGSSLMGDMRIAATAALTTGTRTLDSQAIGRVQGNTGTALGTHFFGSGQGPIYLLDRQDTGQYPVVLATNEGLLIRNPFAGPATGTFSFIVVIEWMEVAAY